MTNNFIGIYEEAISDSICNELVDFFEKCDRLGLTVNRQQKDNVRKFQRQDDSLFISTTLDLINYHLVHSFANLFWSVAYKQYADEYDIVAMLSKHNIYEYKIQRTPVGGGYHSWHCEQDDKITASRVLAFTCYLNDVAEGGETEFLYYPKRIPAKKGTVVIFPGSFTHAHRGNPPISNTKYIVTGWIDFCG